MVQLERSLGRLWKSLTLDQLSITKIFLGKVKGKGLGVSLLLDPDFQVNYSQAGECVQPQLPSKAELQ